MPVNPPDNAFGVKGTLNIESVVCLRRALLVRFGWIFCIPECFISLHEQRGCKERACMTLSSSGGDRRSAFYRKAYKTADSYTAGTSIVV